MKRSFALPVAIFAPIAVLGYVGLFVFGAHKGVQEYDILGIVLFAGVALLSEMMAVDFRLGAGSQQPKSSLAFLPFLASIVVFAPHVSVATVAAVVALSQLGIRRNDALRATYNAAQASISAGVAAISYHVFFGGVLGFITAAALFFGMNILSNAAAISHVNRTKFRDLLLHMVGPNGINLLYDFLAIPIVALLITLYQTTPSGIGILIVLLPLLLFHYFYVSRLQLIDAHNDLLRVLVITIETRDPYTSGHSVRVATLARQIAIGLGIQATKVSRIETAALLHDIGKIDPELAAVLRKPYQLTAEEFALIKTHPRKGADLLRGLHSVPQDVIAAVLHHHERYDGQGYPEGLAGDQIPLGARVIMLADSIDAMLSDRPYREALPLSAVEAELERCSGSQFDPVVVRSIIDGRVLQDAVQLLHQSSVSQQRSMMSELS
jgi:putative nucleotidyltransferase with HDIG domain